jgi:hypothetical protein
MKLTEEQSRELLRRTGNYLKEACDRCGKPLAEVRYTCRGEPGEFCSALCRDGEATVESSAERRRNTKRRIERARAGRESARTAKNVAARP